MTNIQTGASLLRELHLLNNEAVSLYRIGRNSFAFRIIVIALNKANENLNLQDSQIQETSCSTCDAQNIEGGDRFSATVKVVGVEPKYAVRPYYEQSQLFQGLYNSAFVFTAGIAVNEKETLAVLLFNLALIMHRGGIQSDRLYQLPNIFQIYKRALRLLHGTSCDRMHIMMAALYVNMAQILIQFNLPEMTKTIQNIIANLRMTIQFIRTSKPLVVSSHDLEFFVQENYFFHMHLLSSQIAPAA
jgi:hypothetical protein